MEKTLQEKAEQYLEDNFIQIASGRGINLQIANRPTFINLIKHGYNLHAQESKAMEDKYKKVVQALNRFMEITKQEGFEYQDNRWLAYKQAESALKDLTQDKL